MVGNEQKNTFKNKEAGDVNTELTVTLAEPGMTMEEGTDTNNAADVTGNTITNSTNKGASGSNSNVRVAAVTGDNSPIVLLSIVLAASLAALIALLVSGIRRKNNRK